MKSIFCVYEQVVYTSVKVKFQLNFYISNKNCIFLRVKIKKIHV